MEKVVFFQQLVYKISSFFEKNMFLDNTKTIRQLFPGKQINLSRMTYLIVMEDIRIEIFIQNKNNFNLSKSQSWILPIKEFYHR